MKQIFQGDILLIEDISLPVLVVSKDFFNKSGVIIVCPIYKQGEPGPLHIEIQTMKTKGLVHCEKMKLFDMCIRGFSKIDRIGMDKITDISDAVQGIFDYV